MDGAFFQQGRIVNNQPKEKDFLKFMNLDPFLGKDDDRTSFQDFPQPLNTRVRKRFCNGFPSINPLGKPTPSKTDEFSEKFQMGEGVIFNPKIYVADFGPLNRAFSA